MAMIVHPLFLFRATKTNPDNIGSRFVDLSYDRFILLWRELSERRLEVACTLKLRVSGLQLQ
jgi:hypothetical protein